MRKLLKSLWCGESGVSTIETILWFPFLLIGLFAISDFFLVQVRQALALHQVDVETRAFATGETKSCSEFITKVEGGLHASMPSATATCVINGTRLVATLQVDSSDIGMGLISRFLGDFKVSTAGTQTFEYIPGV